MGIADWRRCLTAICGLAAACVLSAAAPASAEVSVLTPSPASWDFGSADIHSGGTPGQTFTFANNTASEVNVNTDSLTGPDVPSFRVGSDGCKGAWLPPSMTCSVQVSFTPGSTGAKSAALELVDDSGTLDVPLSGSGITGTLTASPNPLNFTPQPWFYGSQQQSINLQNSNDAGTQTSAATITGPDASRFSIAWGQNCGNQQFGPGGTCGMGINFNPPNNAGTFHAELELDSDSLSGPLLIPLNVTVLNGPHTLIGPEQTEFGAVAIGKTVSQTITAVNDGDAPMQVQQAFMVTGTPSVMAIATDRCTGQVVDPGSSCRFTVDFTPDGPGYRDASVIFITNGQGSIIPVGFSGTGTAVPAGAVVVDGNPAAGSRLGCRPVGYPEGTTFAYAWLRNGRPVAGADTDRLALGDADVGSRFACRVVAGNAVATQTASSAPTVAVMPLSLTGQFGAFSDESVCRTVDVAHVLSLGSRQARAGFGSPATPWAPLTLSAPVPLRASIDGQPVGDGRTVTLSPRRLAAFTDGVHALLVTGARSSRSSQLQLTPCDLALRASGGPGHASALSASSHFGMSALTFTLPPRMHVNAATGHWLGWVTLRPAGSPSFSFDIVGAREVYNDVTVAITRHTLTLTNLPPQTGVVGVTLLSGVVSGRPGTATLVARERGRPGVARASTPMTWLR
jgi:hypothetical protein